MALNIPMPESPGSSLLQGLNTGSTMFSRMIQPVIERERLKQQQDQFVQNYALQKAAQGRANALMPYMIQQYQDTHRTAASEADMKDIYRNLLKDALAGNGGAPSGGMPPQMGGGQPPAAPGGMGIPMPGAQPPQAGGVPQGGGMPPQAGGMPPQMGGMPNAPQGLLDQGQGQAPNMPQAPAIPAMNQMPNQGMSGAQEHELRPGNPRFAKLDAVAGLVPGIPKPVQHINNGMVFTTYPSGRMTVQQVTGSAGQTPGERNVSAKEASKIRDQATALVNSANLVQQGYDVMDEHPDLTGIGTGLANKFNLSNQKGLGKFINVTGKLQAELGKYASSRGGIQAVKWAQSVKPSEWKPEDYNYDMFDAIGTNLKDEYNTLNQQYKAATGQDLPIPLPNVTRKKGGKAAGTGGDKGTDKGKVTKWKMTDGQLVKE